MKAFLYLSSYLLAKVLSGDLSSKWDSGWSGLSMMDDSLFSNLISKSARCAASHRASLPDEFIQSNAALPEISHDFSFMYSEWKKYASSILPVAGLFIYSSGYIWSIVSELA